jgi:WD40 repeat protein
MNPINDFDYWVRELQSGRLEQLIVAVRTSYSSDSDDAAGRYRPWVRFLSRYAHLLRRGTPQWPAYKILLQLATQMPPHHPVRLSAENWLNRDNCDWLWLRNVTTDARFKEPDENAVIVIEHDYPDAPRFWGTIGVYGATVLRDGTIASWGGTCTVRLWTPIGAPIQTLRGHRYSIHGLIEEEAGTLLSWSTVNRVIRWSRDGRVQREYVVSDLPSEPACLDAVLTAPDGCFVTFTRCRKGCRLSLWGTDDTPIASSSAPPDPGYAGSYCFNPDFVSWAHRTLTEWGVESQLCNVLDRAVGDERNGALAWSGTIVRSFGRNGTFQAELNGHSDEILGAVVTPGGRIVTWGADAAVLVWSMDGTLRLRLAEHDDMVVHVLVDANDTIWSWDFSGTLIRWNASGAVIGSSREFSGSVEGAQILSDRSLVAWSSRGEIYRYNPCGKVVREFRGHTDRIMGVLERDDQTILSWSLDGTVRLWCSVFEERKVTEAGIPAGRYPPRCFSFSAGEASMLCTYSRTDPSLRLWSATGKLHTRIDTHTSGVRSVWPVETGAFPALVWWSDDDRIGITGANGRGSTVFNIDGEAVTAATVGENGDIIVGTESGTVAVYAVDGQLKRRMQGHTGRVTQCHWIDAHTFITASRDDRGIRIWLDSECDVIEMPIPDYKFLVGQDGSVFAWSNRGIVAYQSGPRTITHTKTNEFFHLVEWLEDGTVAAASLGGEICLWNADGTLRTRYTPYPDAEELDLYLGKCHESTFYTANSTAQKLDLWRSDGTHLESLPFDRFEVATLSCSDRYDRKRVVFTDRNGAKSESFWASGDHFCRMIIDKTEDVRFLTDGDSEAWDILNDGTAILTESLEGITAVCLFAGKYPVRLF